MVAKGTIQMRSESRHVKWYRIQFVRSYKKVSFQPSLLLSRNEIGIQIELETLFHTRDKILPSKYLIPTFVLSKKNLSFFYSFTLMRKGLAAKDDDEGFS